jgi:cytochrome P450
LQIKFNHQFTFPTSLQLAKSQQVQEKLREEILNTDRDISKMSLEEVYDLPYLDLVINESLRLNPPIVFNNRVCSENIELEAVKGHKVSIEKGTRIFIPMLSFHHDPGESNEASEAAINQSDYFEEYFHDPEDFIPERFNPEHGGVKAFKDRGVLIPFGDGPRICLGK